MPTVIGVGIHPQTSNSLGQEVFSTAAQQCHQWAEVAKRFSATQADLNLWPYEFFDLSTSLQAVEILARSIRAARPCSVPLHETDRGRSGRNASATAHQTPQLHRDARQHITK